MTKERLEQIKENVHVRCSIANITGIGMSAPDREEDELLDEIERLNYIMNEIEKYIILQMKEQETLKETKVATYIFCKLQELKGSERND